MNLLTKIFSITDENGNTELMRCAIRDQWGDTYSLAKNIINSGASLDQKNNSGKTALMLACKNFQAMGLVELLLMNGADVNIKDNEGHTAITLYIECHRGFYGDTDIEILDLFISKGAIIDETTYKNVKEYVRYNNRITSMHYEAEAESREKRSKKTKEEYHELIRRIERQNLDIE